jgi:hypothetical protein
VYPRSLAVNGLDLGARVVDDVQRLQVDRLQLDLGGPTLQATAIAERAGDDIHCRLDAGVDPLVPDQVARLWPHYVAADVRQWVVENLTAGKVRSVRFSILDTRLVPA